jgi:hypothetical protein
VRAPLLGNLKDRWLQQWALYLQRLNAEGLEGRLLYWGLWVINGSIWGQTSLFLGGAVGQTGVGLSAGDFEIWLEGALEVGRLSL